MEILIAFLIGLGIFNSQEEAMTLSEPELQEIHLMNHQDMVDQYGDEYISIFGTDETEIY